MNDFDAKVIDLYNNKNLSTYAIAKELNTYAKKVQRTLKKHGYELKDKSEAQKAAIKSGRAQHPTEGKELSQETKNKISESQGSRWDGMTENERQKLANKSRDAWNKKTDREKRDFFNRAAKAVREAATSGSKLEKLILEALITEKYKVEFHKEHWLRNVKLHTDLFLPDLRTVIEVDGPPHHKEIWGKDKLNKNRYSDSQKNGLVLGAGLVMIRIKQKQNLSQRYVRLTVKTLLEKLQLIENQFPPQEERYIEI